MFRLSSLIRPLGLFSLSSLLVFFCLAMPSQAASCTAKIVWISDDQPNIAEAGKPISFTWQVQNQSSCTADKYHLGFESSEPDASVDFGGMNHPPFTLAPWETGFVQVDIPAAPEEVGTTFK